jgi:tetratricopeptide (TPR) repeat protein
MKIPAKHAILRLVETRPVYRAMPRSGLRTYAALKYHGQHPPADPSAFVRSLGALPTRWLPTAVLAARAAFRTGQDDLLEDALAKLERRHADAPEVHLLRADLLTFHGRYAEALACAELAQRLRPSSVAAMARIVQLGYRVHDLERADQGAVTAVREFPLAPSVLWPVATACTSAEQYRRIQAAWDAAIADPAGLFRVVRQLAVAASRGGLTDAAADLYLRAIRLLPGSGRTAATTVTTRLDGLGSSGAIDDLCRALDDAGIPFFFAAGTALGLVREGRPVGADRDIDLGIFEEHWDRDALIALFTRDPRFDLDLHPQSTKVGLRHRGGSPIDIFKFYEDDGKVWHDGLFVRWHNSAFTVVRRDIGGRGVPVPEDADTYLTENYGDWRTPNAAFDAFTGDAPNLEVTWPEYQRVHYLRRAYDHMVKGEVDRARHDLELAGEGEVAAAVAGAQNRTAGA